MAQTPRAPLSPLAAGEQQLSRELGGYLVRVLRLRAGDAFVLFDPEAGTEADAEMLRDVPTIVKVGEPRAAARVTRREVVLLQGFAKGDKPEQVLRAAVALGASAVTFVRTADDFGIREALEGHRQRLFQASEIFGAIDLTAHGDIKRPGLFLCGIIATDMDGIGEYTVVLGKNLVRAVALVGIRIDDKYAALRVNRMQVANGYCDIVEDAVAKSAIGEGMVCSTGEIAG